MSETRARRGKDQGSYPQEREIGAPAARSAKGRRDNEVSEVVDLEAHTSAPPESLPKEGEESSAAAVLAASNSDDGKKDSKNRSRQREAWTREEVAALVRAQRIALAKGEKLSAAKVVNTTYLGERRRATDVFDKWRNLKKLFARDHNIPLAEFADLDDHKVVEYVDSLLQTITTSSLRGTKLNPLRGVALEVMKGGSTPLYKRAEAKTERSFWSKKETADLCQAIRDYYVDKETRMDWASMLSDPEFSFHGRTTVDLKDRFRVLRRTCARLKNIPREEEKNIHPLEVAAVCQEELSKCPDELHRGIVQASAYDDSGNIIAKSSSTYRTGRGPRNAFSPYEVFRLLELVNQHGQGAWSLIAEDEMFRGRRSKGDLKDKWRHCVSVAARTLKLEPERLRKQTEVVIGVMERYTREQHEKKRQKDTEGSDAANLKPIERPSRRLEPEPTPSDKTADASDARRKPAKRSLLESEAPPVGSVPPAAAGVAAAAAAAVAAAAAEEEDSRAKRPRRGVAAPVKKATAVKPQAPPSKRPKRKM